jgi:anti-sigma B factor antagonist
MCSESSDIDRGSRVNLTLSTESAGDVPVLDVRGEIDLDSAPALREQLTALVDGAAGDVVADLTNTSFIDSTGLAALVAGNNRAQAVGGSVRVVCSQPRILKLFRITALDEVLKIYPSRDEAVAAVTDG